MGQRGCAGLNFGWQEMLTIIPIILQKFRLELPVGAKIDRQIKSRAYSKKRNAIKIETHGL